RRIWRRSGSGSVPRRGSTSSDARNDRMSLWRYRFGFLGAWALALIAVGVAALAVAGEIANLRDSARIRPFERVDHLIATRFSVPAASLRGLAEGGASRVEELHTRVSEAALDLDRPTESAQTILISTAENKLWVRRGRKTVFSAIVST